VILIRQKEILLYLLLFLFILKQEELDHLEPTYCVLYNYPSVLLITIFLIRGAFLDATLIKYN